MWNVMRRSGPRIMLDGVAGDDVDHGSCDSLLDVSIGLIAAASFSGDEVAPASLVFGCFALASLSDAPASHKVSKQTSDITSDLTVLSPSWILFEHLLLTLLNSEAAVENS